MKLARIHIFQESASSPPQCCAHGESQWVETTLGEILPLLIDACRTKRAWLHDFSNEPVALSSDLYEVLQAYRAVRRASA